MTRPVDFATKVKLTVTPAPAAITGDELALERVKAAAAALYPSIADFAPAAIAPIKKPKPQTHLISPDLAKTYCGLDVKTAAFGKIGKATCKECKRLSMETIRAKWIADYQGRIKVTKRG